MIIVAILLVFASLAIGASARQDSGTITLTITADKNANLQPGDIVTFTVFVKSDYNCIGMRWPIMFQTNVLEMVTESGNIGNVQPLALGMQGASLTSSLGDSSMFISPYTTSNYGCLLVQWTANTFAGNPNYYNKPQGEDCFTFQLRVKPAGTFTNGASSRIIIPTLDYYRDNVFYHQALEDTSDSTSNYTLQTLTVTQSPGYETVTAFNEAPALLKRSEQLDVVVDNELGYLYGFTEMFTDYWYIEDYHNTYLRTTGGAKYTITPNEMGCISTGAVLHLTTADDVPIRDYTFIVFGDLNGDRVVNSDDAAMSMSIQMYALNWMQNMDSYDAKDHPVLFAADVNFDGIYDNGADFSYLIDCGVLYKGYLSQTRTLVNNSPVIPWS